MNQNDQMREALRMYMSAGSGNSTDFDLQARAWSMAHQALNHTPDTGKMAGPAIGSDSIKEDLAASLMAANSLIGCLIEGKQITTGMVSITRHRIEQSLRNYQEFTRKLSGPSEGENGGST
ncbi:MULTISPECIES: hypothetical protein [unclassified Limnobacter]|uniref:hypothetical protein n=1 Tax=unclassified Limnobacter TaxID=2630203 RepID=UPI000C5E1957|nr:MULTISPECIES: hypothetical protein [unclassified Limnobacter]MAG80844.1 hypothetical protein [Sutterellaceae bacterium]MBT85191.1 hypothetical protein [Sutterellaceae bacterium]|tara:strand:+ start:1098 stop:1460 length:363 start_codon:yes stop_codon:yes gene_type:complete